MKTVNELNQRREAQMKQIKTISEDEIQKMIVWIRTNKNCNGGEATRLRNNLLFCLMLDAGLRVGEVTKLIWNDIWDTQGPVYALHVRAEITKTHSARYVPLTGRIKEAIRLIVEIWCISCDDIRAQRMWTGLELCLKISTRQVERIIKKASLEAIGRAITPHVLRHTFASRLMRTSSIRVVQELLGHKRITSTQIYTHPNSTDLTLAINSLDCLSPEK